MTFVLCHADGIQVLPRDVNRGSRVEQWPPSAPSPLQLPRPALLKQHVLSAARVRTHARTGCEPVETDPRPSPCLLLLRRGRLRRPGCQLTVTGAGRTFGLACPQSCATPFQTVWLEETDQLFLLLQTHAPRY